MAFIAAAQAGLIVTIVLWSLRLPQTTRSGVIVLLALIIWAEAMWALFRVASRVDRRLAAPGPRAARGEWRGPGRSRGPRSPAPGRARPKDQTLNETRSRREDRSPRH